MTDVDRSGCQYRGRRHGREWDYRRGCRCPDAREEHRLYSKRRREGRLAPTYLDATGTQRRIQALMRMGWPGVLIEQQASLPAGTCGQVMQRTTVKQATITAIRAAYDTLWALPGPSKRTQRRAESAGYAPPLAWDDDEIDDPDAQPQQPGRDRSARYDEPRVIRACRGEVAYDEMWPAERAEAVRRLNAADKTDGEIAAILRADHKTIGKRRIRMGLPSRYDPASYLGRAS
jgi:hypothetical protein